jgi:hypothetical protein
MQTTQAIPDEVAGDLYSHVTEAAEWDLADLAQRVEMLERGAVALNPEFADCDCWLAAQHADDPRAERIHDLMLNLEGPKALSAFSEVLVQLHEGELFFDPRSAICGGVTFSSILAQHHWRDQAGAYALADILDVIWQQMWHRNRDAGRNRHLAPQPRGPGGHRPEVGPVNAPSTSPGATANHSPDNGRGDLHRLAGG